MNKRAVTALLILGGAIFAFRHLKPESRSLNTPQAVTAATHDERASNDPGKNLPSSAPVAENSKASGPLQAALPEITKCFPELKKDSPASLHDLIGRFSSRASDDSAGELNWKNVHVESAQGKVLRIQFLYTPEETAAENPTDAPKIRRRVRLYSEDAEGLPVPEKLPPEIASRNDLSDEEIVDRVGGKIVMTQENRTLALQDGSSAEWTIRDNRIEELMIRHSGRFLGCDDRQEVRCKCVIN
jgi:hypothetical protein